MCFLQTYLLNCCFFDVICWYLHFRWLDKEKWITNSKKKAPTLEAGASSTLS